MEGDAAVAKEIVIFVASIIRRAMIIGRKQEQQELLAAYQAEYSFTFQHTGMARGKMKGQLLKIV